jgi:hypothetical protein
MKIDFRRVPNSLAFSIRAPVIQSLTGLLLNALAPARKILLLIELLPYQFKELGLIVQLLFTSLPLNISYEIH